MSVSIARATGSEDNTLCSREITSLKTDERVCYFIRDETERLFAEILCILIARTTNFIVSCNRADRPESE